jgi:hypothetical protein
MKIPSALDQIRNNKDNWTECIGHMEADRYQKVAFHCHPTPRRDPGRPRKERKEAVTGRKDLVLRVRKRRFIHHIIIYKPYYTTRWSCS